MVWLKARHSPVAEAYDMTINIEPHGYYTTKPEFLAEMLSFADSPYLALNMGVGNVFIAGQAPVEFVKRFHDRISLVHVTGISGSDCAIGEGTNAENVRECSRFRADCGYRGVVTIGCEADGGPLIDEAS